MHLPLISEVAGVVANIASNIAFLPQIVKSYRRKQVDDLSIGMFFILFMTQVCWILYAVPIGAVNLWVSSLIEILLLLPLFVMWYLYKTNRNTFFLRFCRGSYQKSRLWLGLRVAEE